MLSCLVDIGHVSRRYNIPKPHFDILLACGSSLYKIEVSESGNFVLVIKDDSFKGKKGWQPAQKIILSGMIIANLNYFVTLDGI